MNYSATERSLFLGDLSVYCTEQDLYEIFQSFGPIESIQLKRKSTANGRPSYGFIQYRFRESAEEALRVMNGRVVHGRAIRLGWAEPPKVEVKIGVTKDPEFTRPPAPISALPKDISFVTNSLAGLGLGKSSVSSSTPVVGAPRTAILSTAGKEKQIIIPPLDGNPILSSKGGSIDTAQVHFSYVTNKVEALKEDVFRNVFQNFGPVLDVAIKKSQYHPDKGVQTGYGFIHYPLTEEGIACALEAVRSLHELVLDSVKYSCRLSHALEEYLKIGNSSARKTSSMSFSSFFPSSFNPFSSFGSSTSHQTPLTTSSTLSVTPPQPPLAPIGMPLTHNGLELDRMLTYDSYSVNLPAANPSRQKRSSFF